MTAACNTRSPGHVVENARLPVRPPLPRLPVSGYHLGMNARIIISFAQFNAVVGDITGNAARVLEATERARREGADLVVLPELFIAGYPPEDLVLRPSFVRACMEAVEDIAERAAGGPAILVGSPWRDGTRLHNSVLLLEGGRIAAIRHKHDLPNYGVFDEKRVFDPGPLPEPLEFLGVRLGVPVCEDIWTPEVTAHLKARGAQALIVPNGSPFEEEKHDTRLELVERRVGETGLPLAYLNLVGGQDELVFDGGSFALNPGSGGRDGLTCADLAWRLEGFTEDFATVTLEQEADGWRFGRGPCHPHPEGADAIWRACVLGTRDYVRKNRFPGVVLGLSGGIDSALVAAIAVDALGAEGVHCVMLPFEYTSSESLEDAEAAARLLGVRYDVVPIHAPVRGFHEALADLFAGTEMGVTEENLQSRSRGTIIMAISNKFGSLVLTTGNKSEMAVGYATLYGDMNGGFNPIKDVYKTQVYELARMRNERRPDGCLGPDGPVMPERIITKPPSAELKPEQTDQDTLPPYDVLDTILHGLIEEELPVREIVARHGCDPALVARVQNMLYIAEYKRRQAAPGVKITRRNFGRDRRYPITNAFREHP